MPKPLNLTFLSRKFLPLPSLQVVAYDNYIDALTFADSLKSMRRDLQLAIAERDDETARHVRKVTLIRILMYLTLDRTSTLTITRCRCS